YGQAKARSPLLSDMLKGPVYLVSSDNKLPDLVADLRGQVRIQLYGVISSKRGGLKTVFNNVPDVPVNKFILEMKDGNKSLIVNSTNRGREPQGADLKIKGKKGKKLKNNKYRLKVPSCKGKKKKYPQDRRPHRRGRLNSLRAGAPDSLRRNRRLEQPGAA